MWRKQFITFLFFQFLLFVAIAQTDSNAVQTPQSQQPNVAKKDSVVKKIIIAKDTTTVKKNRTKIVFVDSAHIKDSLSKITDSLQKAIAAKHNSERDTTTYAAILNHPFLPFNQPPIFEIIQTKPLEQKDELFYLLIAIVFLIALVKVSAPKYFDNVFALFFQTSFRQKHTRDQLLQYKLASLCMNIFFFITGGLYISLIAQHLQLVKIDFWLLLLYCFCLLIIIYGIKYLFLVFSGWVFNVKEAAGTYVFVVFLVNKITGIVLLPVVLLLAFSGAALSQTVITVSLIIVGLLLLYRYIVSVGTVRRDLKVNAIHFFLYLCTVEIMPLLLIYKMLFNYIGAD